MSHALCDHQAIDAIGGEVFHVTVEQTRAFTVQHAVAITNDGADRRARSAFADAADSFRGWTEIGLRRRVGFSRLHLVWKRKLLHRDLVLVRMTGPRAVHQTVRFILFVRGE